MILRQVFLLQSGLNRSRYCSFPYASRKTLPEILINLLSRRNVVLGRVPNRIVIPQRCNVCITTTQHGRIIQVAGELLRTSQQCSKCFGRLYIYLHSSNVHVRRCKRWITFTVLQYFRDERNRFVSHFGGCFALLICQRHKKWSKHLPCLRQLLFNLLCYLSRNFKCNQIFHKTNFHKIIAALSL